nr:hypothetical protein [Tanacetum cinerariifolium]
MWPKFKTTKKHSVVGNDIVETDVASHHIKTINRHIADALGPVETMLHLETLNKDGKYLDSPMIKHMSFLSQ